MRAVLRRLPFAAALVWLVSCGEPPKPSYAFSMWAGDGAAAAGLVPGDIECSRSVPAFGLDDAPASPRHGCTVTLDGPDAKEAVRLWEMSFATPEKAEAGLRWLLGRRDGADPGCTSGCKAVVSGWVQEQSVYWVTNRALAFEPLGCKVIEARSAWRVGDDAPQGMHHCP
jgi:hypothetical protein